MPIFVCLSDGHPIPVRFTQKDGNLYATLLGIPAQFKIRLGDLGALAIHSVSLFGSPAPLDWALEGTDLVVTLPSELPRPSVTASACSLLIRLRDSHPVV